MTAVNEMLLAMGSLRPNDRCVKRFFLCIFQLRCLISKSRQRSLPARWNEGYARCMNGKTSTDPFHGFHPLVRGWFLEKYGSPTQVQAEAWPRIAAGGHLLASAPTGSGKTLAAFLVAISRFAAYGAASVANPGQAGSIAAGDGLDPSRLSVLYVSPLKALNEDIRLNLLGPLWELDAYFAARGESFPRVRVATRSGDTPPAERRRTLSDPPSILCTTPESLAILLASRRGLELLSDLKLVILDEVHAVLGTKRGTLLACSVGRLVALAGEFQRVALSATVKPFEAAAGFVGGQRLVQASGSTMADEPAVYEPRPVAIVAARADKRYELSVEWPPEIMVSREVPGSTEAGEPGQEGIPAGRYTALATDLIKGLDRGRQGGRPTIVFTDSRRRAERLAALLNELGGEGTAWAHHGSLSREVRHAVEERLRRGELPCVVATGTLELGIDIGSVEEVALAGTPSRTDQVLQRVGRAGHSVGRASTGVFYPFHGMDLLQAAAAVGTSLDGEVDTAMIPEAPLDILAQTLLSMVLFTERDIDGLYDEIRGFSPYTALSRTDFDRVIGLLAGRYRDTRLKELAPRVYLDSEKHTIRAREGAAMLIYSSGGSIPDRGYYAMRLAGSGPEGGPESGGGAGTGRGAGAGAKIGELDEEFVFERRVGNSFAFGSQAWKIVSIGDESVTVVPLDPEADFMPFWKADKAPRGQTISQRMLKLCALREADPGGFRGLLTGTCGFSTEAADALVSWLDRQQRSQGGGRLPSPSSIALETYRDPLADTKGLSTAVILHTLRGLAINEPLGLALAAKLEERTGLPIERLGDDDSILLMLPLESATEAEALVTQGLADLGNPGELARLVRSGLEATGAFGAAFRENAGRALLLPRSGFGKRTPLWVTRLKAKRLFAKIKDAEDFPITAETWRSVLEGRYDLPGVAALCEGLVAGDIELLACRTTVPSPFASRLGWTQTNRFLYEGDELGAAASRKPGRAAGQAGLQTGTSRGAGGLQGRSALDEAVERALGSASLRPAIPAAVARELGAKLRRELPGWAPETPAALADWVDERVFIPLDEWEALLAACDRDLAAMAGAVLSPSVGVPSTVAVSSPGASSAGVLNRLISLSLPGATRALILRRERKKELLARPQAFIAEWLRSSGPIPVRRLQELFGLGQDAIEETLAELEDAGLVIRDQSSFGIVGLTAEAWVCDREVLDGLLRVTRRSARAVVRPRPAREFPGFVAYIHGLGSAQSQTAGTKKGPAIPGLDQVLDRLNGFPARAGLWETELLPARIPGYKRELLDRAIEAGNWLWFGVGKESVAFSRVEDLSLFIDPPESTFCPPGTSPRDVWTLKDRSGMKFDELQSAIWKEVWRGSLSADSFEAVRKGLLSGFKTEGSSSPSEGEVLGATGLRDPSGQRKRPPRIPLAIRDRWKHGSPLPGRWFGLTMEVVELDEADELDLAAHRVRALARRYGLVARFLLERELPLLGWSNLFAAIRRLELAGELVSGHFFDGIDGPQFMAREQLAAFRDGAGLQGPWTVNACDPAAPGASVISAGLWPGSVPARVATTRITSLGSEIACVSRRSYRELDISVDPEHEMLPAILAFFGEARNRDIDPVGRIILEKINRRTASSSPYASVLKTLGFESDRTRLVLW
jgi:ATP-dependent Lhr-like helicase